MKVPHLPCKQLDLHVTPMTMLNGKNTVFTNSIFMLNTLTFKTCFFFPPVGLASTFSFASDEKSSSFTSTKSVHETPCVHISSQEWYSSFTVKWSWSFYFYFSCSWFPLALVLISTIFIQL